MNFYENYGKLDCRAFNIKIGVYYIFNKFKTILSDYKRL